MESTTRAAHFLAFESILGLQFENLVLDNLPQVLALLRVSPGQVLSASPYFQNQTRRQQACQVDLLIDTKYAVYLCEIKFRRRITTEVVQEVMAKASRLKIAPGKSLRRALVYAGALAAGIEETMAFDQLLPFDQLLSPVPA